MRCSQWLYALLLVSLLLVLSLSADVDVDANANDINAASGDAVSTSTAGTASSAAEDTQECTLLAPTSSNTDEVIALQYISSSSSSISSTLSFRVHGWRWHTASVLRELKLLHSLLLSSNPLKESTATRTIQQAVNHVIAFNMKGLHRVEESLFFPWLQSKLNLIADEASEESFQRVLSSMVKHQGQLVTVGNLVIESVKTNNENLASNNNVANLVQSMITTLEEIRRVQNDFMVPAVSLLVSEYDQVSFNNQVLRNMGILDSRIYLVGMYEAVLRLDEIELFEKEIPMIPRYMIPRWKRLLYDPRTAMLVHGDADGDQS